MWADINNPLSDYSRIYSALSNDAQSVCVRSTVFSRGTFAGVFPSGGRQKTRGSASYWYFRGNTTHSDGFRGGGPRIKLPSGKLTVSEEEHTKARGDAVSDTERKILDHLCERIKPKGDNEDDDEDAADKKREQLRPR